MAEKRIFTKEEKELMITMFNEGESYTDIGKKLTPLELLLREGLINGATVEKLKVGVVNILIQ